MSWYPGSEKERRISSGTLRAFVAAIFERCAMNPAEAALVADSLVAADLRGIHSHGVLRVPEYAAKLLKGGVDPTGQPRVVKERAATLVVDGDNSMGQVASMFAMRAAIERARTHGIAFAATRGSNHCGAMFYYAAEALGHDMIGLCASNALPTMAPWGGIDKIVGINPFAAAIPTTAEAPIVLDAAFSYSSHGKIRVFHQKGESIPPTWAFDKTGRPTTDPEDAIEGLLQPIGEYKGVGLAVVFGVLSTLLSGAAYGTELGNMVDGPRPGMDGHFFAAIDISSFLDPAEFRARADAVVRQIRQSRRREGAERLYAPGGMEFETEAHYRSEGIPLNEVTLQGLHFAADQVGASTAALDE